MPALAVLHIPDSTLLAGGALAVLGVVALVLILGIPAREPGPPPPGPRTSLTLRWLVAAALAMISYRVLEFLLMALGPGAFAIQRWASDIQVDPVRSAAAGLLVFFLPLWGTFGLAQWLVLRRRGISAHYLSATAIVGTLAELPGLLLEYAPGLNHHPIRIALAMLSALLVAAAQRPPLAWGFTRTAHWLWAVPSAHGLAMAISPVFLDVGQYAFGVMLGSVLTAYALRVMEVQPIVRAATPVSPGEPSA